MKLVAAPDCRYMRLCRGVVLPLLWVLTIVGTVVISGPDSSSAEASNRPRRPNVLIIMTDDQHLDTLAAMPTTRRLFLSEGTAFSNAFVTTPLCCPGRVSVYTGQYAHNHGVLTNRGATKLLSLLTLQRYLRATGYLTGVTGKWLNSRPLRTPPPHFDRWAISNGGYNDVRFNINGKIRLKHRYTTNFIKETALRFLNYFARIRDRKPWALIVNLSAPHNPWTPHPKYADAPVEPFSSNPAIEEASERDGLADKHPAVAAQQTNLSALPDVWAAQQRTLLSVDELVQALFQALNNQREANRTLAFFMTDNGFLVGEHGILNKFLWYLPSVRTPLMMRWPGGGIPAGAVDGRLVANIDVAPTILEAARIRPSVAMDGRSLLSPEARDRLLLESWGGVRTLDDPWPTWAGLITTDRQYVETFGEESGEVEFREFYDLTRDPWQLTNLLNDGDSTNDEATQWRLMAESLARTGCAREPTVPERPGEQAAR